MTSEMTLPTLWGNDKLKLITHERLLKVKSSVGVDWMHSENARARIRVMGKINLRKYGYPPDMQESAVRTVLEQAERLSYQWTKNEFRNGRS